LDHYFDERKVNAVKGIESAFVATLSKDPELKEGKNGKPYANFSCTVASENGESQWANVICFGDVSKQIAETARKGDRVYVEGSLSLAKWENSAGETRSGLAVSAWRVERIGAANLGRNRQQNEDKPLATLPIALPAIKRRKFGLFRRAKKVIPQVSADNGRPFDDELSF
jgi:single stranded DNA-binding protein